MKITRSKYGANDRPERIFFKAPPGTAATLEAMTAETKHRDQRKTGISDIINAIFQSNRDYRRAHAKVQKEEYDTSNHKSNTETTDDAG